jgi:protein-tyrosine phosphatase
MVGFGLNLSGLSRGGDPAAPLTSRAGDADANVNVNEKTVGSEETREVSSSSGSDEDSDDDVPLAERPTNASRPVGVPTLGLSLDARGATAVVGSNVSYPTSPRSGTSLSARKPPGLGLRIKALDVGGGSRDAGDANDARPGPILDLESLRDSSETQASELTIRREKFAHFEKHCTRVFDGVYVSGEAGARNLETLRENGITHVLNCNAFVIPNYFETMRTPEGANAFTYEALWLQDVPGEDVTRVLYDCFDFIRRARERENGRVLVHCSQGVSRSVSVVISYLMWHTGDTYEKTFAFVKSRRGIANPNMGFTCQMLQWRKRVSDEINANAPSAGSPRSGRFEGKPSTDSDDSSASNVEVRLHRLAPHSEHDPRYLVAKTVAVRGKDDGSGPKLFSFLDARGAFVVEAPRRSQRKAYVWVGPKCVDVEAFTRRARVFARQLFEYDGLGRVAWGSRASQARGGGGGVSEERVVAVRGGEEPEEFLRLVDVEIETDCETGSTTSGWSGAHEAHCASYDSDFDMYVSGVRSQAAARGGAAVPVPEWAARVESAFSFAGGDRSSSNTFDAPDASRDSEVPSSRPRLFAYPSLDPVTMYDEEDLDSARIFLVLVSGPADGGKKNRSASRLWIGRDVDVGGCALAFGGRVAEECLERVAETLGEAHRPRAVEVELEGKESNAFWEAFEAGQE